MSELLRKISVKSVCGDQEKPEAARPLMHVIGMAHKVKEGETDFGPWQKLLGQFEAVNLATGEVYQSPQCILPEPMNGMIAGQLLADPDTDSISFAVEVGIKPSARKGGTGYEYTTKPLVETAQADPLAALRSQVKQLEAPIEPAAKAGKK